MVELKIMEYHDEVKEKWDNFVMQRSANGTFLQTKQFLEYHGERFVDASIIIYKGNDTFVAVVPAVTIYENDRKIFHAHYGSTFGGIVLSQQFFNIEHIEAILITLETYLQQNGYAQMVLKCTSDLFSKRRNDLLYYYFFQRGYYAYDELSCYIDFQHYQEDIISNFTSGRRRDYKYSLKNNLEFRQLDSNKNIAAFYSILCNNLEKFDAKPVHSLDELLELKEKRLRDIVAFYGVFLEERLIAGSMVFLFARQVFHTQYLASDQAFLKLFPMNFLNANLIRTAQEMGFQYFSFGTSTREHGKVLNKHLAEFKEGFGTDYGINRTFVKTFSYNKQTEVLEC